MRVKSGPFALLVKVHRIILLSGLCERAPKLDPVIDPCCRRNGVLELCQVLPLRRSIPLATSDFDNYMSRSSDVLNNPNGYADKSASKKINAQRLANMPGSFVNVSPVNLRTRALGIAYTQAWIERKVIGTSRVDPFALIAAYMAAFAPEPLVKKITCLHQGSVSPQRRERGPTFRLP